MGNTKTLAEPQHEAPVVAHEAKAPEKVPGPQREKSSAAHSTPPNDARSAVRSAGMLGVGSNRPGANPRANMMMGLQRSVGNARVSSLLSKKTSKAVTSQLFRPQIKKNVKEKEREEGPKSVDEQAGEIGVPEPEQPPKVSLTSLLAEPKKAPSEPASGTANSDSTSHEETGNNISPLLTGQVSRLIASPLTIARVQDEKPANSSSDAEVTSGNTEARKADPGKIKDLKARLTSARRASHRRIESQTPLIKADLTKNADQLHQSVDSQVATAVTSLKIAFDAERKELQATVQTARGQLTLNLFNRRMEAVSYGDKAKKDIADIFNQYRVDVSAQVQASISEVNNLRNHRKEDVANRITQQVRTVRHAGDKKAASYPPTERGEKQTDAALEVATETANKITEVLPEALEAVDELVQDIPEQFRDHGKQASEGIDKGLAELQEQIDEHVGEIMGALDDKSREANQRLDEMEADTVLDLSGVESAAIDRAKGMGAQAAKQIDAGLKIALARVDAAMPRAEEQIRDIVDQTIEVLDNVDDVDLDGATEMTAEIVEFVAGATDEIIDALKEARDDMRREFPKLEKATSEGLQSLTRLTSQRLTGFHASAASVFNTLVVQHDEVLGETTGQMNSDFQIAAGLMKAQLDQSVGALAADFRKTVADADVEIVKAISEGLAKNDEAIGQLDSAMDKAAEKAAWDHDHWVLAGIRDAAAFIGGLILAIVIVIGLVVVVILAFELIIAALVYVGVPAAVAKLLVVVGGLVWLGYQVYSAYQNRISRGESGWGAFGGALADVTGITDMKRALTEKGLSPFERGFLFGRGIATVATFVFGRRLYNRIRARLPKSITNPTRGGAWRALKERFGKGGNKRTPPPLLIGTNLLAFFHELLNNPKLLARMTEAELRAKFANDPQFRVEGMSRGRHAGTGLVIREVAPSGDLSGRLIQYHPGTPRHFSGRPYWKVSNGAKTIWVDEVGKLWQKPPSREGGQDVPGDPFE